LKSRLNNKSFASIKKNAARAGTAILMTITTADNQEQTLTDGDLTQEEETQHR